MKKLMLIFMFCMVMLFVGCGKQEAVESIVCDKDVSYEIAELESSQTHVSKPAGVCVFQNQVIVCDKEENKLSILDMDLNFVKEIKTFAPNEDELFVPTGMTVFEDKLYLLDSGNNRILILDSEFAIVEAIALKPIGIYQGDFRYTDVAVDKEGIIYVCSDNYMADDCVFVVENGEVKKTKQHFYGFLTEYKGEVYAVDSLELSEDGTSPKPGKNCVYRMNKTKMKK